MRRGLRSEHVRRVLGVLGLVVALAGCWPAPGQGPDRRAHNPFETTLTPATVSGLEVRWTASADVGEVGDPIASGSHVHFAAGEQLYGVAAATGARQWTRSGDVAGFAAPMLAPIADDGRVLASQGFPNFGGAWRAEWVDAATGAPLGEVGAGMAEGLRGSKVLLRSVGVFSGSPEVSTVTVEVVDLDDPDAGWRGLVNLVAPGGTPPPMTLGTQRVYEAGVGTMLPPTSAGNGVRAFPAATAPPSCGIAQQPDLLCPTWATPIDGDTATSPVLDAGETTVYVGTDAGTVYALDAATGTVRWTAAVGATIVDSPALAGGMLYVPTDDGDLVVLAADGCGAATCSPLWQGATGSPLSVQPAVAGGVVFTGSSDGTVTAFDAAGCGAASCPSLWDADAGATVSGAPAVSAGRLYVGAGGDLVAFGLP